MAEKVPFSIDHQKNLPVSSMVSVEGASRSIRPCKLSHFTELEMDGCLGRREGGGREVGSLLGHMVIRCDRH